LLLLQENESFSTEEALTAQKYQKEEVLHYTHQNPKFSGTSDRRLTY